MTRLRRAIAALLVAAVALPAAAYVLSVPAILRRLAARRAALSLASVEVTGTLQADGAAGAAVLAAGGVRGAGGLAAIPARIAWKVPGRCRVELTPPDAAEADRPFLLVRDDKVTGDAELAREPAFSALARAICTLLAVAPDAQDADRPWAAALQRRGVTLGGGARLGRFDGRISYVIGGRPTDTKPLAWIDKESFQPVRLLFNEAGKATDVRLLGWGSPTGGDWAPRAIEVHAGAALQVRFTTEKASANPRLPELLFQ
ncbi:MAG TPA: hypothetical protein VLT47_14050 [Anaeromyxobacteraceae bacterium]|nr:hypothetical protein [Anaeromyxobacteraceae bacterium]